MEGKNACGVDVRTKQRNLQGDEIREEKCTRKASGADRMLPGAGCATPAADADTPATNPLKTTLPAEA